MKFKINKKIYILLITSLVLLGLLSLIFMTIFMVNGFANKLLLILAIVFSIIFIAYAVIISPSLNIYEKKSLVNKLSKKEFKKIQTNLTLDNYEDILYRNNYRQTSSDSKKYFKKLTENTGDGLIDLDFYLIVSEYIEGINLDSPIKEELHMSTSTYMWIIFSDSINDDILVKIKNYELNEIGRIKHKLFHKCCYYPIFLISNGILYYLSYNKASTNEILNIIKKAKE